MLVFPRIMLFTLSLSSVVPCNAEPLSEETEPRKVEIQVPDLDRQDWDQQNLFDRLVRLTSDKEGVHGLCYRSEWIGKPIQVEGVLWQYEIIHHAGSLSLERRYGEDEFSYDKYSGQLVRAKGVLRHGNGLSSRFGDIPPHFYIEPSEIKVITKVTAPFVVGRAEDKDKAAVSR